MKRLDFGKLHPKNYEKARLEKNLRWKNLENSGCFLGRVRVKNICFREVILACPVGIGGISTHAEGDLARDDASL